MEKSESYYPLKTELVVKLVGDGEEGKNSGEDEGFCGNFGGSDDEGGKKSGEDGRFDGKFGRSDGEEGKKSGELGGTEAN